MLNVAVDFETELIDDRTGVLRGPGGTYQAWSGMGRGVKAVLTSPWKWPRGIVMSFATSAGEEGYFMLGDRTQNEAARDRLLDWLNGSAHVVFHNAPFDLGVARETLGISQRAIENAIDGSRVHDTVLLDMLVSLYHGLHDYVPNGTAKPMVPRSLKVCLADRLGITVDKDTAVRLTFGQFRDKLALPDQWKEYAIRDARYTLMLFQHLAAICQGPATQWLSETIQVQCGQVVSHLDTKGIAINRPEAERLYRIFAKDIFPLEERLVRDGLGTWQPLREEGITETILPADGAYPPGTKTPWLLVNETTLLALQGTRDKLKVRTSHPSFKINQAPIRVALQRILEDNPQLEPPKTPQGELSLDGDWWNDKLPAGSPLKTWCRYSRLRKVLSGYLELYRRVDRVFPRWDVLKRTGRMSASSPNVQNIPKRRYGLRSLFVPDPGHLFVVADYSTQELLTLAEVMYGMGIEGPLLGAIRGGIDIHTQTASLLSGKPMSAISKAERQGAKAVNFGVPGGLGAKRLRDYAENEYGVRWSIEEAKAMHARFKLCYPDISAYLRRIQGSLSEKLTRALARRSFAAVLEFMGMPAESSPYDVLQALRNNKDSRARHIAEGIEHSVMIVTPTGRVRSNCRFTEGANSLFQGTASDVTKRAAWLALQVGVDVRLLVHDEIVAQAATDQVEAVSTRLTDAMLLAFQQICPIVGPYAKLELTVRDKWGEAKDGEGRTV